MPISFIAATVTDTVGTSIALSKPAGTVEGDLMIAYVFVPWNGSAGATAPAGWNNLHNDNGLNQSSVSTWYKFASASEPTGWTWQGASSTNLQGGVTTYRGLSRSSPFVDSSTLGFNRVFAFTDSVIFGSADFSGVTQKSGMLFIAAAILAHNGSSHAFSWPPAGMNSRIAAANTAGNRGIYVADKIDVNPPISAQTPGNITYTHSGGSFQDWDSFTYMFLRYVPRQSIT